MSEQNTDVKSLAHTKWNCKYHVVFTPKYRRKVFYNEKKEAIREIIRTLCQWKGVEIIEGEVCPDHIHLLPVSYTHLDVYKRQPLRLSGNHASMLL